MLQVFGFLDVIKSYVATLFHMLQVSGVVAWVTTSTNMGIGPYSKKSGGLHPQLIKKMPIQCPQRRLFTPQMPGCIYACERVMMHLNNTIVQKSTSDIYVHV